MDSRTTMDKVRDLFRKSDVGSAYYEPLDVEPTAANSNGRESRGVGYTGSINASERSESTDEEPFSWFEYSIFLVLGVAMLWAWNMFLAAAPYFQTRFQDNERILKSFQSAITSVGCVTNLSSMLILGYFQAKANYPKRILISLVVNLIVFTLLAVSTTYFRSVTSTGYLVFTLIMVFSTSVATGLCQNGAFAFASSFGRPEYIQAIMTGQAVAGVLPSVAQIVSVLAVPPPKDLNDAVEVKLATDNGNVRSAAVYFLTATGISILTLLAVFPLIRKHKRIMEAQMMKSVNSMTSIEEAEQAKRKVVSMWTLYKKLHWSAAAIFVCFAVTMFFPVFTQKVVSIMPPEDSPRLFQPSAFIPLGFLVWNLGDLTGRLTTLLPFNTKIRPVYLFVLSIVRGGHIPLYFLCNLGGKGAVIQSDAFYLFVVTFGFGATNGWLGSVCMMGAGDYVEEGEREAAGGFMAVNLVAGLMAGSLLSFAAANVA